MILKITTYKDIVVSKKISLFIHVIIHQTHYLLNSDWLKACNEFMKSAPVTSSSYRLYNTCNHVFFSFVQCIIKVLFGLVFVISRINQGLS